MATQIYLGYPPPKIKEWIEKNYKPAEPDMLATPLHFTANEDNSSVSLICFNYDIYETCNSWCEFQYSMTGKDDNWSDYEIEQIINLNKDETVYFRAKQGNVKDNPNLNGLAYYDEDYMSVIKVHMFIMEGSIKSSGNIQFLLENTGTKTDVPKWCYSNMFHGCRSLTQAPLLPATTIAEGCYQYMFKDCSSLIQAPELPAEILFNMCYRFMFDQAASVNNINVNFTVWNEQSSYATYNWLNGVSSTGTFTCPEVLPDTPRDASHIPAGWSRNNK